MLVGITVMPPGLKHIRNDRVNLRGTFRYIFYVSNKLEIIVADSLIKSGLRKTLSLNVDVNGCNEYIRILTYFKSVPENLGQPDLNVGTSLG